VRVELEALCRRKPERKRRREPDAGIEALARRWAVRRNAELVEASRAERGTCNNAEVGLSFGGSEWESNPFHAGQVVDYT